MNQEILAIGMMSGTSCDGTDLALIKFSKIQAWEFEIIEAETIAYDEHWKSLLLEAHQMSATDLQALHASFGTYVGVLIHDFIVKNAIAKSQISFIASHGHTVFHNPALAYSTQIGSGAHIAKSSGVKTVCDFRMSDVAAGGQGAPLVPIADQMLFGSYQVCLNLGGFANISFEKDKKRLAFDICPVNIVLNELSAQKGLAFDEGGKMARAGKPIESFCNALDDLAFYNTKGPKSLGREFVAAFIHPLIEHYAKNNSIEDLMHAFVLHAGKQIGLALQEAGKNCLVTGGGCYNDFLIENIKVHYQGELIIPNNTLINFKEALAFAFLGLLRCSEIPNTLHSVTGASNDTCAGAIYLP